MTPFGEAVSKWSLDGTTFMLTATVPAGTQCQVVLPSGRTETVGSGTWTFEEELK
jgi:alpha-L-rhamnosidase